MKTIGKLSFLVAAILICMVAFTQKDAPSSAKIWGTKAQLDEYTAQVASGEIEPYTMDEEDMEPISATADKFGALDLTVDVAANNTRFALDPEGVPGYGGTFIVKGFIYPEGTFAANDFNGGINEDGTASWPELVIGEWSCRGWFSQQPGRIEPSAQTVQQFDLNLADRGTRTIVTSGYERPIFRAYPRATVGGTGKYRRINGQCFQTTVGFNLSNGANFTHVFEQATF